MRRISEISLVFILAERGIKVKKARIFGPSDACTGAAGDFGVVGAAVFAVPAVGIRPVIFRSGPLVRPAGTDGRYRIQGKQTVWIGKMDCIT